MNTTKQRIKEAAAYVQLTPGIKTILKRFFLDMSTNADREQLDDWLNEREENSRFFDVLLQANRENGAVELTRYLTHINRTKTVWWKTLLEIAGIGFIAIVILYMIDYRLENHPVSGLLLNPSAEYKSRWITNELPDEAAWLHLPDSSMITLHPRAQVKICEHYYRFRRELELNGWADFNVLIYDGFPMEITAGELLIEVDKGEFALQKSPTSDSLRLASTSAYLDIKLDGQHQWKLAPGEKAVYTKHYFQKITP